MADVVIENVVPIPVQSPFTDALKAMRQPVQQSIPTDLKDLAYVRAMPLLGGNSANPLAPESKEVKEVKEIFGYFSQVNPKDPVSELIGFLAKVSSIPNVGETKLGQMLRIVRTLQLSNKLKSDLNSMGVT